MEMIVLRNSALIGNKEVTTIRSDDGSDTFYFAASELAAALGYIRTQNAVTRHTKEWMRTTLENIKGSLFRGPLSVPGGEQPNTVFVTEPGLYSLVSRSKLRAAENFQRCFKQSKKYQGSELQQLGGDIEQAEVRRELVYKSDIVKDPEAVLRGKKGGLVAQEKIRQIKKDLEKKEFQVCDQEKEITELKDKVLYLLVEIDELEDELDERDKEIRRLEDEKLVKQEQ
ncbi:Hypothetical predicted protein [Paramuricea clavata]|uniref:Uncharacterized protein n=1 Tax=Paramuricea clavata TaxID=317549 RepID=A0A6S7G3Q6_PARCT|nr:Hypothetical predicted protein [Paramuricea clavata]